MLLVSLIDVYKDIIENKKTDNTTLQKKQQAWNKLAVDYNSTATMINTKRTVTQLKKLWSNIKQRKRKTTTELKHKQLLTIGGSKPDSDPLMKAVDVAVPHVVTLEGAYDLTASYEKNEEQLQQRKIDITRTATENVKCVQLALVLPEQKKDLLPVTAENPKYASLPVTSSPSPVKHNVNQLHVAKKKRITSVIEMEANLRVQKLKESLRQQEELHNIRMQVEHGQLQVTLAAKKKAEAEAELALLQLQLFKKDNDL